MEGYSIIKSIGMGSYAICYSAIRQRDNLLCVIKQFLVPMDQLEDSERGRVFEEIDILSQLHHVNIIRLYDHFIQDNHACIVMEYADRGSLRELFNKRRGELLRESFVLTVFAQLMNAMAFIHAKNILHRDIKPANILFFSDDMVVKLADFGISKRLVSSNSLAQTIIGTPYYLSPELCRNEPYGKKSDIWAAGCVLYELLCGQRAFHSDNIGHLILSITTNQRAAPPMVYSTAIRGLLDSLLVTDAALRPTAEEILEIPIVRSTMVVWNCHLSRTAPPSQLLERPEPVSDASLRPPGDGDRTPAPPTTFSPLMPHEPPKNTMGPSSASFRRRLYQGASGLSADQSSPKKPIDD